MKIKILVLNINDLGGIERVAVNLYNMFLKLGSYESVEIVSVYGNGGVNNNRVLKGGSEKVKLFRFANTLDRDTVVLSLYDRLSIKLSILRLIRFRNFKLFACQHADYFAHPFHTRVLRGVMYKWVDKIIALTQKDCHLYKKKFSDVYVIPNALSFFPQEVSLISNRKNDCAVAGRLVKIKQYNHFVEFIKRTQSKNISHKILGSGVEENHLQNLIEQAGLNDKNILVGEVKDIEIELDNIKFFFVTSLRESFSMVILEAMACGCIVISYDCPTGPGELINSGINGFLVPINNIDALVDCYEQLVKDPSLCQEISMNAREFSKNFLDNKIIDKWNDIIYES